MTCYNSELPIGPPGPTGPQGPPGNSAECCVERILNNIDETSPENVPFLQTLSFSLEEDGEFIEFDFDTFAGEYVTFSMFIDSRNLIDILNNSDINRAKGTVNIERLDSSTILLKLNVLLYELTSSFGLINFGSSYYHISEYTIDVNVINFEFNLNSEFDSSRLLITKILKYKLPYL